MNKQKLTKFVNKHKYLSKLIFFLYNRFPFRNKLKNKHGVTEIECALLKKVKFHINGANNKIHIKNFSRLSNCTFYINGSNNTIFIDAFVYMNNVELCIENCNNEIKVGSHSTLYGPSHYAAMEGTKIILGNNCLLSSDIHFRTGDSHSILNLDGKRINPSNDIIIGDHVWIGTKVTCLKDVVIPNDCIIAATTTLCKKFDQPNCIIGGVPSKVIKTDVNWCKNRITFND